MHGDLARLDAEVHERLGAILVAHEDRRQLLARPEDQMGLHAIVPRGDWLEPGTAPVTVVHVVRTRGNGLDETLVQRLDSGGGRSTQQGRPSDLMTYTTSPTPGSGRRSLAW